MNRSSLLASLVGAVALTVIASSALAMGPQPNPNLGDQGNGQKINIPDPLFDKTVPDSWDNKSTDTQSTTSLGGFRFSVRGSNDNGQPTNSSSSPFNYGGASVPLSEFNHTPGQTVNPFPN